MILKVADNQYGRLF